MDPRGTEPPHLVHPPMALASRLYDDYDSSNEVDDHELFQVFTPPPRFETPSPSSPMYFSGLVTPETGSTTEESVFQFPTAISDFIADSEPPRVMSTPQRAVSAINSGNRNF